MYSSLVTNIKMIVSAGDVGVSVTVTYSKESGIPTNMLTQDRQC